MSPTPLPATHPHPRFIAAPQAAPPSISHPSRSATLAAWFGISPSAPQAPTPTLPDEALPHPGQILLIIGPSGAGKSTLLKHCRTRIPARHRLDLDRLRLPQKPLPDLFPSLSLESTLYLLSRVGLAEAHTYLLTPRQLSDGQRWRLRLALALYRAAPAHSPHSPSAHQAAPFPAPQPSLRAPCLFADEFAAILDPVTAAIIAHTLRRAIAPPLRAILATCRTDLLDALRPDIVARCDFGTIHFGREHS